MTCVNDFPQKLSRKSQWSSPSASVRARSRRTPMAAWSGSSSRQNQAAKRRRPRSTGKKGATSSRLIVPPPPARRKFFFDLCKGPPPSGNPLTEKISKRRLVFRRRERGYKNFRRPKLPHYCGKTINNQADLFTFSCGQLASFVDTFRAAVSKVRAAPAKPSGFSTPRGLRAVHISADNQPIAAGLTARAFVVGRKRRNGPLAVEKSPAAGRHGKKTPA